MKAVLFVVLILSCAAFARFSYSTRNYTKTNNKAEFSWRKTVAAAGEVGTAKPFLWAYVSSFDFSTYHDWVAPALSGNTTNANISGNGNGGRSFNAYAAGAFETPGLTPFCYHSSIEREVDFNISLIVETTKTQTSVQVPTASVSFTSAASFALTAFEELIERDPTGNKVKSVSLITPALLQSGIIWHLADKGFDKTGDMWFAVFRGSVPSESWSINITFIASSVAGVVDGIDVAIGPNSLEALIEIDGWSYSDPKNTLNLAVGVFGKNWNVSKQVAKSGSTFVFLSNKAYIDGKVKSVIVNQWTNLNFATALGRYRQLVLLTALNQMDIRVTEIQFPAGSNKISYDPAIGAGEVPQLAYESTPEGSPANMFLPSLFAMLVAFFSTF